ncbi:hypothetical protein KIN20_007852 [Parelaphostrongylus tenuis]|uniref:Reverse transcriptase n=1 Tax=Parelaphostrongylus tenuis TaxID=148309 RepID=A0AAD5MN05_PARTN|nr:hypothetical protein KIN20_007852 [Parelaphostrongylus tenuis]
MTSLPTDILPSEGENSRPLSMKMIRQRGIARAAGDRNLTSELAKRCREAIKEDLKERRAAVMAEAAEAGKSIRKAQRGFANYKTKMIALRYPDGTLTASRRAMEEIIHQYYSDLFASHVLLPSYKLKEDEYVVPPVLPSEIRHAISSVKNRTTPGPDRIRPEHLKNLPPVLTTPWLGSSLATCQNARSLFNGKPARPYCCSKRETFTT